MCASRLKNNMNAMESPTYCTPFTFILLGIAVISESLPALKAIIGHDDEPCDVDSDDEIYASAASQISGTEEPPIPSLLEDLQRRLSKSRGCLHTVFQIMKSRMFEEVTGIPVTELLKRSRSAFGLPRTPHHVRKEKLGRRVFKSALSASEEEQSGDSDSSTPPSSTEDQKN